MPLARTILFLQGHPSTFASHVAREIGRRGGRALRINFCWGDRLLWTAGNATDYRGRLEDWPEFLRAFCLREKVTDIVYYADRLPYHRDAAIVARQMGIRTATYEFGYLRPDWITLERGGMSAWSHFPRSPETIRRIAASVGEPDLVERYGYSFIEEAVAEVTYNAAATLGRPLFPYYQSDKYYHPVLDYLSYIPRMFSAGRAKSRARRVVSRLLGERLPFFVCPMQMQNDYQLRANSPYRHQSEMIEEVIESFSGHAPGNAHLVFKLHPLDNGLEGWPAIVESLARTYGVLDRVHLILGSDLRTLLTASRGVVVINSTVGVHALRHGRPVKVLGAALYDIAGLTHQPSIDTFWTAPTIPDPDLCASFVRAIAATIQIKGNFFTKTGRAVAVPEFAARLLDERVNAGAAFEDPPPRLARALALGIPFNLQEAAIAVSDVLDKPKVAPQVQPVFLDEEANEDDRTVPLRSWRRISG